MTLPNLPLIALPVGAPARTSSNITKVKTTIANIEQFIANIELESDYAWEDDQSKALHSKRLASAYKQAYQLVKYELEGQSERLENVEAVLAESDARARKVIRDQARIIALLENLNDLLQRLDDDDVVDVAFRPFVQQARSLIIEIRNMAKNSSSVLGEDFEGWDEGLLRVVNKLVETMNDNVNLDDIDYWNYNDDNDDWGDDSVEWSYDQLVQARIAMEMDKDTIEKLTTLSNAKKSEMLSDIDTAMNTVDEMLFGNDSNTSPTPPTPQFSSNVAKPRYPSGDKYEKRQRKNYREHFYTAFPDLMEAIAHGYDNNKAV